MNKNNPGQYITYSQYTENKKHINYTNNLLSILLTKIKKTCPSLKNYG